MNVSSVDGSCCTNTDRQAGRPGWKDVWVDGLKDVDGCGWKDRRMDG